MAAVSHLLNYELTQLQPAGVDQTNRRKWDRAVFEQKAKERLERENGTFEDEHKRKAPTLKDMKPIKAREEEVDLTANLGKAISITANTPADQQAGFYCELCDCLMKDSQNYLDHINGKKHQRLLGTSLRPERATVEQVREKLRKLKEQNKPKKLSDFDLKMNLLREREREREREKQQLKEQKAKQKQEKKQLQEQQEQELKEAADPELASLGLPVGFGTSKK